MLGLIIDTYVRPRETIGRVLNVPLADPILIRAAALVAVLQGLLQGIVFVALPPDPDNPVLAISGMPLAFAALQFAVIMITALGVYKIGRGFGGTGDYNACLKIAVWYGVISLAPMVFVAASQTGVSAVSVLLQIGLVIWLLVAFSIFVQEVHGFQSLFLTVVGVIGGRFVVELLTLFVLGLFGVIGPSGV